MSRTVPWKRTKLSNKKKKRNDPLIDGTKLKDTHVLSRLLIDYETTDQMDELMIPPSFQHKLIKGVPPPAITKLRTWQYSLLSRTEWKAGKSCVVVSPTSGGKTLIAEIAIAQLMDDNPFSRVIYALPFVSLAMEKYQDMKKRFSQYNVRPFFQSMGGNFRNGTIAICTYEKAHTLINNAIKGSYFDSIKLFIMDEVHMIGDETRGIVAETLLMKMRMTYTQPRIIALSATVNLEDARKISHCINGFYHICTQRTAELREYISMTNSGALYRIHKNINENDKKQEISCIKIATQRTIPEDRDKILPLVKPLLARSNGQSILIFVNTRNEAKRVALFIANNINKTIQDIPDLIPDSQEVIKAREQLISELAKCSTGLDKVLSGCILKGIAYHHAGLLLEERRIVEHGIQHGQINLIVATTTLSAGVNIRSASRVIVYNPYRTINYNISSKRVMISPALLAQMAGRSGRTDTMSGDVIVIGRNDVEFKEIQDLYAKPIPGIESNITKETTDIESYILQTLSLKLSSSKITLEEFINYSFAFQTNTITNTNKEKSKEENEEEDKEEENPNVVIVKNALDFLFVNDLIDKTTMKVTRLGNAIAASNLSIYDGIRLNNSILKVMKTLCLVDNLHLLFLCIPSSTGIYIPPFSDDVWEMLFKKHSHVIHLITDKGVNELERIIIGSYTGKILKKDELIVFERIYAGCILERLIDETSLQELEQKFKVDRGTIQILQTSSSSFAGQATKFCDEMGYTILSAALTRFRKRLEFGVREELVELMELPSCSREVARVLYSVGIRNAHDCSEASMKEIIKSVRKGRGGPGSGLSEDDIINIAKSIRKEAKQLSKHKSLLEQFSESATMNLSSF